MMHRSLPVLIALTAWCGAVPLAAQVTSRPVSLTPAVDESPADALARLQELGGRPEDPDAVRRLVAGLRHPAVAVRAAAARALEGDRRPYVAWARLDRLAGEDDSGVRTILRRALLGGEIDAWSRAAVLAPLRDRAPSTWTEEEATAAFHVVRREPRDGAFVGAWAGAEGREPVGLDSRAAEWPLRRVAAPAVELPAPHVAHAVAVIIGIRQGTAPSDAALDVELRSGDRRLVGGQVQAGHGLIAPGTRCFAVEVPADLDLSAAPLHLGFDPARLNETFLHGIAVVTAKALSITPFVETVEPGSAPSRWRSLGGWTVDDAPAAELVTGDGTAGLQIDLGSGAAPTSITIDHRCADPRSSTWDVEWNGRLVIRLISQPMPRPVRAEFRQHAPLPGWNEIRFRRVEGSAALVVERVRLWR